LIHLLDNQAVKAINSLKPMLITGEQELYKHKFKLSNMPSYGPLISGLAMLAFAIVMEQTLPAPIRYASLKNYRAFSIAFQIIDKSSAVLFGVYIYHTIRKLLLVNTITSEHIRINLFNLKPLEAFSRLTATTSFGILFITYAWALINPELLSDPLTMGFSVAFTLLAIVIFIWPLYGAHRLIKKKKESILQDIDLQFGAAVEMFKNRIKEEDFSSIDQLNGIISSLEIQYNKVNSISTWPWSPETVRSFVTAITAPLIFMVIQFIFERVVDW
jgi:hypothetical protein